MTVQNRVEPPFILPVSARGAAALAHTSTGLAAFLEDRWGTALGDAAHTLVHGREGFEHRLAVLAGDTETAAALLRNPKDPSAGVRTGVAAAGECRTVFAFTGQGGQYTGMAAGAYAAYPEFREWLDRAHALLDGVLPYPLLDCLFDPDGAERLARTDIAAPALLAVQFGLVRVLARYGIRPDAVLGHSVGEFAAAAVAGAVSEEDALLLVAERGRLMVEKTEPGTMLSVRCRPGSAWDTARVARLVADEPLAAVAAVNSPRDLVLSGERRVLERIEELLGGEGVRTRRLSVSHAFHSPLLRPMADEFHRAAEAVAWSAPASAAWFSCAAGPMATAPDAAYWREHLLQPVEFWDALSQVCAGGTPTVLVEVGPHPTLLQLAGQLADPPGLVQTLDRERDAAAGLAGAAAQAWCLGVPADLTGGVPGRRIHLPGYGFDRRVHSERPESKPSPSPSAGTTAGTAAAVAPEAGRPSARDVLEGIWTDLLSVTPEDCASFVEAGGDSLALLRLRQRLEAELGSAPGLAELLDAGTFAAMLALLPEPAGEPSAAAPAPAAAEAPAGSPRTVAYRPSLAQQRMLFVDLMQDDSNQHNVTLAVDIAGRVDPAAMREAFTDAQRRHSGLRTVFHQRGGQFETEILAEPGVELSVLDTAHAQPGPLRPLTGDEDVREWVRELGEPPLRCFAQPPVRATLVLGPERSLLVITVHHAVTDATSMGVMVEDLAQDYHRRRAGDDTPARANRHQFHDVLAELERAERNDTTGSSAYWRSQLDGAPDLVPLPTDRPRPEVRAGAGAMWGCDLDPALASRIRALSAELNTTPFSTMLTAYAVLLRHHSGADDMAIATPVTSRSTEAAQRVFGLMLNTLVLRVKPGHDESFTSLARSVSAVVLEGIQHSAFPFDRLVAELNPKRHPGRTPLFSVMFAMPVDFPLPAFDGLPSRPVELPGIGAKFDLTLYVTPAADGGLHLDLEYDPALFDEATVRQWGADYTRLLEAVVADPGSRPSLPAPEASTGNTGPKEGTNMTEDGDRPFSDLERYVADLWSQTLKTEVGRPDDDFFAIGGHSLQVLTCLVEIQERYPDTTIQDFFAYPTVEQFAARLAELGAEAPAAPVPETAGRAEAVPEARPARSTGPAGADGGEVLLTGATGFLGAHVLAALLREPGRRVTCVVRGSGEVPAGDRLARVVEYYVPDVLSELPDRVRIIEGDLSTIGPDELAASTEGVRELIHAAAEVRHYGPDDRYAANNIAPTALLARLALERGWRMAHMSTLSAVGPAPGDGPLVTLREDDFDRGENFDSPYARSKYEAELAVRKAIADGLDATVHRVGTLVGNTRTGTFLPDPSVNMMYQILRVILTCGLVPSAPGWGMDLTPVDFAADAILRLSRDPAHSGRTFHVSNPVSLPSTDLAVILRDLGYAVIPAAPQAVGDWLGRPGADAADANAHAFLAQFVKPVQTLVEYDAQATAEALGDLRCPRPDAALLRTLIGHGIETGFFPKSRLWDFATLLDNTNAFGAAQ
ncbi:thioester reductase-like protein [Streptomyces sp. 3211.6]|uniref:condensation domain-containing protein n=1 Tax=Streptomyces sp. 3211.6 TaxID=1938845 RepID=UPI000EACD208|nr:condensation domain-containing protein [Streptomyces sp. 3211.6]RKT07730.1 thioester reductase-like protein [Streptomyces sp. 3211.6]